MSARVQLGGATTCFGNGPQRFAGAGMTGQITAGLGKMTFQGNVVELL